MITDDTGKTLFATKDNTGGFGGGRENGGTLCYNLTPPDTAATALTITPVEYGEPQNEERTITTEEMKKVISYKSLREHSQEILPAQSEGER